MEEETTAGTNMPLLDDFLNPLGDYFIRTYEAFLKFFFNLIDMLAKLFTFPVTI